MLQLQEIFRKKNEKKSRKGDAEKSAQLVRRFNIKHIISNLMGLCHKKVEKEMCQHIHVNVLKIPHRHPHKVTYAFRWFQKC